MRQRIGQYAYLTGIAVVAVAIGTALTVVSRLDFAERGMNGTLAWMQTTGMPMRPAMSVMMTAEIDPAGADDAGTDVELDVPDRTRPGVPTRVTATVVDAETGEPIDSLQPFLAAAGHIVVMRADGTTFAHEHAEVEDSSGRTVFAMPGTTFGPELNVHARFDTAGTYQLWGQFRTADGDVLTVPFTVDAR